MIPHNDYRLADPRRTRAALAAALIAVSNAVAAEPQPPGYAGNVVCVAGCTGPAPRLVQPMRRPVATAPLPKHIAIVTTQPAKGVWCSEHAGCWAVPARAPYRADIAVTHSGVSVWSW